MQIPGDPGGLELTAKARTPGVAEIDEVEGIGDPEGDDEGNDLLRTAPPPMRSPFLTEAGHGPRGCGATLRRCRRAPSPATDPAHQLASASASVVATRMTRPRGEIGSDADDRWASGAPPLRPRSTPGTDPEARYRLPPAVQREAMDVRSDGGIPTGGILVAGAQRSAPLGGHDEAGQPSQSTAPATLAINPVTTVARAGSADRDRPHAHRRELGGIRG